MKSPGKGALSSELGGLRQQIKRMLALRAVHADKALTTNITAENRLALETKLRDAEGGIGFRILTSYRQALRRDANLSMWPHQKKLRVARPGL
jgi:hypothetical protein